VQTNFILKAATSPPGPSFASLCLQDLLPAVLVDFRISFSIALVLLIAAEMIGTDSGTVPLHLAARNLYRTDDLSGAITDRACPHGGIDPCRAHNLCLQVRVWICTDV
jgi:hypothetical protein